MDMSGWNVSVYHSIWSLAGYRNRYWNQRSGEYRKKYIRKSNRDTGMLALIAAVVSIIVKEWMFWYTRGAAKKINSGALMADAWHHRSDAMSSVGAFVGIFGARMGYPILDPIASVVICLLIGKASIDIFRDAVDKMVDRSCDRQTEESIRRTVLAVEGVKRVDLYRPGCLAQKSMWIWRLQQTEHRHWMKLIRLQSMYIMRSSMIFRMLSTVWCM